MASNLYFIHTSVNAMLANRKIVALLMAFALTWCVALLMFWRNVPVGLCFAEDEIGSVGCVVTDSRDGQYALPKQEFNRGSSVSFSVPLDATHFFFRFPRRDAPYRIKALCLYGQPLFGADWVLSNIAPRGNVYARERVKDGTLLVDSREENGELDYVRFFDLIMRLARLSRYGLAFLPMVLLLAVMLLVWVWRNAGRLDHPRVYVPLLTVFTVLSFPNPVWPSAPGLDSSWTWLINHVAWSRAFGADVVFTYGPLGFLLHPEGALANALAGLALSLVFAAVWFWLLHTLYFKVENGRFAAWLLLFAMLFPQMNLEWRLVVTSVLLVAVANLLPEEPRQCCRQQMMLGFGGMFLAVNALIKFSSFAAVFGTQAFCLVWLLFVRRKRALRPILAFAVSACVTFVILGYWCFSSFGACVLWLRGSIATAQGYNIQMVAGKGWLELLLPFAIVASILLCCLMESRRRLFLTVLVALPFLFCAVKYAIVRQSALPLMYGSVAMLALASVKVPPFRRRALCLAICFYCLSMALIVPYFLSGLYDGFPFGLNPSGVVKTLRLPHSCEVAAKETESLLPAKDIPSGWRDRIGGGRVLFVPVEMAPAMGRGTAFKTVGLPSLQLYSACHPYLDALNAALIDGEDAPDWIICGIDSSWSGHLVNYPRFWSAVLARYRVEADVAGYLLLHRRGDLVGATESLLRESESVVAVGAWLDCRTLPSRELRIVWERSWIGRFCGTFLRATRCFVTVRYDDGVECRFQLIADNTAEYPFLIDRIPANDGDFVRVLKGLPIHVPVALKFDAESPAHLLPNIRIFSRSHD